MFICPGSVPPTRHYTISLNLSISRLEDFLKGMVLNSRENWKSQQTWGNLVSGSVVTHEFSDISPHLPL